MNEITIPVALDGVVTASSSDKWRDEQRAFYRQLGDLLKTHRGQFVAIHKGRVVGSGRDIVEVALRAHADYGGQPIYVDIVEEHPLPPVRFPHYQQPSGPGR